MITIPNMPPLPSVTNVVLFRLKGTYSGQPWNNIFHLQYTGAAPSVADLQTIGTSIVSSWTTNIAQLCIASVVLTGVDLADLTNPAASAASITANVPGTRTGSIITTGSAVVSSWQINIRYRGGHPRTYWPAGVAADITSGRLLSAGAQTAFNAAFANWRASLNALTSGSTTYKMVIVSYQRNLAPRPTPLIFTVNGVTTHGRLDTQRRRLGKETP